MSNSIVNDLIRVVMITGYQMAGHGKKPKGMISALIPFKNVSVILITPTISLI